MTYWSDIHPDHIDPETNRPYAGYSSPALDTSFADGERVSEDRRWSRWLKSADVALGLKPGTDCDGDESVDGYSLDTAYDAFRAGIEPVVYAAGERA